MPTPACQSRKGGRPEKWPRRDIVDAIRYLVDSGCKYRALPRDFPPWRTVYGFLAKWAAAGVLGAIRDQLRRRIRQGMGRAPHAVAIVIDSQSVKAAETVGKDSRGHDAGKKINGRKRHLVVDTKGLPLLVMVTPADIQDRDAGREVLFRLRLMHPELTAVWADSAYAGQLVDWAKDFLHLTVRTVSRPKDATGFVVLPRRWVVERRQAHCTHGCVSAGVIGAEASADWVQRRRLYQPAGRVRRSWSSASSSGSACAMSRWGCRLSLRAVSQPLWIHW